MAATRLSPMDDVLEGVAAGRLVVVLDDEHRENEGDLVLAAELATQDTVAFMIREARGGCCAFPKPRARS